MTAIVLPFPVKPSPVVVRLDDYRCHFPCLTALENRGEPCKVCPHRDRNPEPPEAA